MDLVSITMKRRAWGSPDGLSVAQYEAGATVSVPARLAEILVRSGDAEEAAPARATAAPSVSDAAPAIATSVAAMPQQADTPVKPAAERPAAKAPRSLSGAKNRSLSAD